MLGGRLPGILFFQRETSRQSGPGFRVRAMNEFRRRRIRSGVITACILAAIGAAIWILVNPFLIGLGGTHKDWFVHVTPENLVEYSQHIVLARYADETVYEIPNPSLNYDVIHSHTDVYRRFEVVETLKGDFEAGNSIYVGWSAGYTEIDRETGRRQFIPRVVAPLAQGEIYGLFLNLRHSRSRHPDDPETRIWETPNGLEVASVDDQGSFSFQTDQLYRNALKDMGLKPVAGSGAPFELTTHGVKRLVASGSGGANQRVP